MNQNYQQNQVVIDAWDEVMLQLTDANSLAQAMNDEYNDENDLDDIGDDYRTTENNSAEIFTLAMFDIILDNQETYFDDYFFHGDENDNDDEGYDSEPDDEPNEP